MKKPNFTPFYQSVFGNSLRVPRARVQLFLLSAFLLMFNLQLFAQPTAPSGQKWNLVVNDDFNSLNTTTWGYGSTPWGSENQSSCTIIPAADTYTTSGALNLRSRKGPFTGLTGTSFTYSSGWAWLKTKRQYGYLEIRAQYPNNRGNWAAFWMLGSGWPPEIDVAEFRGTPKNYMTMANYDGTWNTTTRTADYTGWHTFGLQWGAGSLKYYIDGVLYKTVTGTTVPAIPMYVILSNGSDCTDSDGTGFPNYYKIDYFRWYQLAPTTAFSGTYEIKNRNSVKCIHTLNSSTADGTPLVQYDCNGSASSKWTLTQVSTGVYTIKNNASGKYAEISGGSISPGANSIIWPSTSGNNRLWYITSVGDGYYSITNVNSGLLLDVTGASTANNANNIQWTGNGGTNQQWTITPTSTTVARISSQKSITPTQDESNDDVSISPNPSKSGNFFVNFPAEAQVTVSVFNIQGKMVYKQSAKGGGLEVNESLPKGVYIVKVNNSKFSINKKLVVD